MFTGIIEEIGIVKNIIKKTFGLQFNIGATKVMGDLKIGDSIAINGVCLTVVSRTKMFSLGSNFTIDSLTLCTASLFSKSFIF